MNARGVRGPCNLASPPLVRQTFPLGSETLRKELAITSHTSSLRKLFPQVYPVQRPKTVFAKGETIWAYNNLAKCNKRKLSPSACRPLVLLPFRKERTLTQRLHKVQTLSRVNGSLYTSPRCVNVQLAEPAAAGYRRVVQWGQKRYRGWPKHRRCGRADCLDRPGAYPSARWRVFNMRMPPA